MIRQYRDGLSLYEYVGSNPISHSDPVGLLRLCICRFKGRIGILKIDCSCRGKLKIWVIPEKSGQAAFTPAKCGTKYKADGFKIGTKIWKIDGSTCVKIYCSGHKVTFETCINCIALCLGKKATYIVPSGTFTNEPPADKPAEPVI